MTRIVRHAYRYKRPPRKRKAVALEVPAIARAADPAKASKHGAHPIRQSDEAIAISSASTDRKSAIITIRGRERAALADVPDLSPVELQRRCDAADALWRELVRRATGKERP
jgi:hypothetical protein